MLQCFYWLEPSYRAVSREQLIAEKTLPSGTVPQKGAEMFGGQPAISAHKKGLFLQMHGFWQDRQIVIALESEPCHVPIWFMTQPNVKIKLMIVGIINPATCYWKIYGILFSRISLRYPKSSTSTQNVENKQEHYSHPKNKKNYR